MPTNKLDKEGYKLLHSFYHKVLNRRRKLSTKFLKRIEANPTIPQSLKRRIRKYQKFMFLVHQRGGARTGKLKIGDGNEQDVTVLGSGGYADVVEIDKGNDTVFKVWTWNMSNSALQQSQISETDTNKRNKFYKYIDELLESFKNHATNERTNMRKVFPYVADTKLQDCVYNVQNTKCLKLQRCDKVFIKFRAESTDEELTQKVNAYQKYLRLCFSKIQFLHNRGYIHGDMKMQNVMVKNIIVDGKPMREFVLSDFDTLIRTDGQEITIPEAFAYTNEFIHPYLYAVVNDDEVSEGGLFIVPIDPRSRPPIDHFDLHDAVFSLPENSSPASKKRQSNNGDLLTTVNSSTNNNDFRTGYRPIADHFKNLINMKVKALQYCDYYALAMSVLYNFHHDLENLIVDDDDRRLRFFNDFLQMVVTSFLQSAASNTNLIVASKTLGIKRKQMGGTVEKDPDLFDPADPDFDFTTEGEHYEGHEMILYTPTKEQHLMSPVKPQTLLQTQPDEASHNNVNGNPPEHANTQASLPRMTTASASRTARTLDFGTDSPQRPTGTQSLTGNPSLPSNSLQKPQRNPPPKP